MITFVLCSVFLFFLDHLYVRTLLASSSRRINSLPLNFLPHCFSQQFVSAGRCRVFSSPNLSAGPSTFFQVPLQHFCSQPNSPHCISCFEQRVLPLFGASGFFQSPPPPLHRSPYESFPHEFRLQLRLHTPLPYPSLFCSRFPFLNCFPIAHPNVPFD